MSRRIHVAYATRYGSTREAATLVAEALRETGAEVELMAARSLKSLAGVQALVLGAPLYFGAWHREALSLVSREAATLGRLPFAIFALGPTDSNPEEFAAGEESLGKIIARFPTLAPISSAVFAGRYDPKGLGVAHRLIALLPASPLHGKAYSDALNPDAIRAWAQELAGRLS